MSQKRVVFNGGQKTSLAYLHLAALGPKPILFNEDDSLLGSLARLTDNDHTWLRFADLVFIDPVRMGCSLCIYLECGPEKEEAKAKALVIREDFAALAKLIRLYLNPEQL